MDAKIFLPVKINKIFAINPFIVSNSMSYRNFN